MAASAATLAPVCLATGPITPEGKLRSSRNAVKHNLFSAIDALPAEDRAGFEHQLAHYMEVYEPRNDEFERLVVELALYAFRIDKVRALQFAWFKNQVASLCEAEGLPLPATYSERAMLEAAALQRDCEGKKTFDRLLRYERAFDREFSSLIGTLGDFVDAQDRDLAREAEAEAEFEAAGAICKNEPSLAASTPRNAPCPCGSGEKFKRCCGKDAPPMLFPAGVEDRSRV